MVKAGSLPSRALPKASRPARALVGAALLCFLGCASGQPGPPSASASPGASSTVPEEASASPSAPEAVAEAPALEPVPAGPIAITSGPPVEPGQKIAEYVAYTDTAAFPVALRENLAKKSVALAETQIQAQAYSGGQMKELAPNFWTLAADPKKLESAGPSGEKNRVKAAPGLLYFDGKSQLGFTIADPVSPPAGWICIGQVQIPGEVVAGWKAGDAKATNVNSLSYPSN